MPMNIILKLIFKIETSLPTNFYNVNANVNNNNNNNIGDGNNVNNTVNSNVTTNNNFNVNNKNNMNNSVSSFQSGSVSTDPLIIILHQIL